MTDDLTTDYLDGSQASEIHHIFGGANRKKSEEDGLIIGLSHRNHNEPPNGLHFNKYRRRFVQQIAELTWILRTMKQDGIYFDDALKKFISRYGKNRL